MKTYELERTAEVIPAGKYRQTQAGDIESPLPEQRGIHTKTKSGVRLEDIAGEFKRAYGSIPDFRWLDSLSELRSRRIQLRDKCGDNAGFRHGPPGSPGPVWMDVGRTAGLQRQAYGEKEIPSHSRDPFLPIQILDLASNKKTPFLLFDMERLMRNYSILQGALKGAEIYYPVKSNDHPHILSTLHGLGSGFEAASWGELEGLLAIGVSPRRIIFGAPIKSIDGIASAYEAGVRLFAYDSYAEISKLSSAAPGCSVYLRLSVPFRGDSIFPLNGKFGVEPQEALQLLQAARKEGLEPCGLSFHVGSQCLEPSSWWRAIASAACVWEQALRAGLRMSILNLGGGIPIPYCDPVPDKEVFLSHIALALSSHFRDIPQLILEPGRAMVGDIAVMVGSVIGKAYREGKDWIYLDTGIYQGLVEAAQEPGRFSYRICTAGAGPLREYIIGGPTCDSSDVIARKVFLPEVECGDLLFIFNTGAYTNVCATNFNGFPPPQIYYLDYGEEVEQ